jgi:FtsZ-interacting cell division protein YlmF
MSLAEKVDIVHEQLIEQEEIKLVDLPTNIKAKIKGWNLLYAKLKKSEDDETLFRSVQRKSIEIADIIQDFLEEDYEEENQEGKPERKAESSPEGKPEPKTEGKPEPKAESSPEKKEATKISTDKSSFGNIVMEKKILSQIEENQNGRIRISQLKSIIGKEPDYPEQKVNNIILRKIFMSSEYKKK